MSYNDWKDNQESERLARDIQAWQETFKDESFESIESKKGSEDLYLEPPAVMTSAVEQIKKLCRVCSSRGLLSIHTRPGNVILRDLNVRHSPKWDVSIAEIIAEVSGTKVCIFILVKWYGISNVFAFQVSGNDSLPQFICQHCLGYLQHAYAIRLQIIRNTENLKQAQQIADGNSLELEAAQLDQKRITKREIEDTNAEAIEEEHFFEAFQGANIKITPNVVKSTSRAIEQKCPSCEKRVMSMKSLNEHMELCEIKALDAFFTAFKNIYSERMVSKTMTSTEFVFYAIRLLFDTQKRLQRIVKAKNIDVNAISSDIPFNPSSFNEPTRNYQSPDNGYASEPK